MKLANFKSRVAAYLNRVASSFVSNGVDNLLEAINDARRSAQLRYDFNWLRKSGFITVPVAGTDWVVGVRTTPGGATPLRLKNIQEVWTYTGTSAPYLKNERWTLGNGSGDVWDFPTPRARVQGPQLFIDGATTSSSVMVIGPEWKVDLVDGNTDDFFLEYGTTWLLYQTIQNLNLYLKEDSRVQIADAVVQRAWVDFCAWDGSTEVNASSINLN